MTKSLKPRLLSLLVGFALIMLPLQAQSRSERVQAALKENPKANWWDVMDTGPFISDTFRIYGEKGDIGALKGIALKVGAKEEHSFVFDTETMRMLAGFKGKVSLKGTPWDRKHAGNSCTPLERNAYYFATNWGPGWAIDNNWTDPREQDNGRHNGPLPDAHAEYLGIYRHEGGSVLSYKVAGVPVLEQPGMQKGQLVRSFYLGGKTSQSLQILVSDPIANPAKGPKARNVYTRLKHAAAGIQLKTLSSGRQIVDIPAGTPASNFQLIYAFTQDAPEIAEKMKDKANLTKAGPTLFPETVKVKGQVSETGEGAYTVDSIPLPSDNPWKSEIRFGAFDFFEDGKRLAASTWNGDVWIASGLDGNLADITWKRYASGLYQALGLKIVDGVIYTHGRDQLTRLHDLNGDGEADYYESFNNDINITEGFHEFAFDLQTDSEGNFYFSKGQPVLGGGRGFAPWTEHSGTILKVSADGKKMERLAWGLRAPGGIGLGPNGELTTGENEGSYVPRCKITWSKRGVTGDDISFHGVVPSEWDIKQRSHKKFVRALPNTPSDYEKPLCWLPYYVDNSSGSQFWVPKDSQWKNHAGGMIHLSYGKSSVYRTLVDEVDGQVQGGVYRLPIELTTSSMRGRFHPKTGHLYIAGFRGWQTNGGHGLQRVRFTGKENPVPMELKAHKNGMIIKFSEKLDPEVASDPRRFSVSKWDYMWCHQYGSGRFSIDDYDEAAREKAVAEPSKGIQNKIDMVSVRAATLLDDGKSVFLYIPEMTPAMQMEIKMDLASANKKSFRETIWNTVHKLRPAYQKHNLDLANLPEIDTTPVGEPGLILSMAHSTTDDAVVVDRLAITLDKGQAATPFIDPRRGREMVFEGSLVIDTRDQRNFRLEGKGWASLKIGGKTILEGQLPIETQAPLELDVGPHILFCNFQREESGEGRLQLLWSGEEFVWEAIQPKYYRYQPNPILEAKDKTRAGRNLFAAAGCIRCHDATAKEAGETTGMPELFESLPDFKNIGSRLNAGWIEQWVRQPKNHCPSTAPESAGDIAAYLAQLTGGKQASPAGSSEKGKALIETLHLQSWAKALSSEAKFTKNGLINFLQNPSAHHADSSFPNLHLSQQEASDIAAHIMSEQPKAVTATGGDIQKGKAMVAQRCLVCHGDGSSEKHSYEFAAKPLSEMWKSEWLTKGCLSGSDKSPKLGLSAEDKQNLLVFKNVDSDNGYKSLNRFVPHEYAHRTMNKLSCAECHSGENTLPDITLAGEKLRDEWLAGLFHGKVLKIRPYQKARMPAFPSRAEKLAKGLAHRAGETTGEKLPKPEPSMVAQGTIMGGLKGYACVSCHAVGATPAVQAFEGQGPNLQLAGERLRDTYYHAWMNWPQRLIPTTIMPKYTAKKGVAVNPQFYEGNAKKQFQALMHWMLSLEGAEKAPTAIQDH